jgi:hypothetical protein
MRVWWALAPAEEAPDQRRGRRAAGIAVSRSRAVGIDLILRDEPGQLDGRLWSRVGLSTGSHEAFDIAAIGRTSGDLGSYPGGDRGQERGVAPCEI